MGLQNRGVLKTLKSLIFLSFLSNKASFMPMCVRLKSHYFLSTDYILPTNHTNLHEFSCPIY